METIYGYVNEVVGSTKESMGRRLSDKVLEEEGKEQYEWGKAEVEHKTEEYKREHWKNDPMREMKEAEIIAKHDPSTSGQTLKDKLHVEVQNHPPAEPVPLKNA